MAPDTPEFNEEQVQNYLARIAQISPDSQTGLDWYKLGSDPESFKSENSILVR